MKTTNYINTFIEVADDCPVTEAEVPTPRGDAKTAASIQFETVIDHPYKFTSDDVLFKVYAVKNNINGAAALAAEREKFFSKGQPCMRASPLTKRYGWGVHSNASGKIALYPLGSPEYKKLAKDNSVEHVKAMRSKRG